MSRKRHVAEQFELFQAAEVNARPALPARNSLVRLSGAGKANGVWKVKSALGIPGGMFLGLEMPKHSPHSPQRHRGHREELQQELLYLA